MGERYFVDQRGGCIAVRDRTLTNPDYPGLHEDTEGVVFYRHGYTKKNHCPTCGQVSGGEWKLCDEDIAAAYAECSRLNESEATHVEG